MTFYLQGNDDEPKKEGETTTTPETPEKEEGEELEPEE